MLPMRPWGRSRPRAFDTGRPSIDLLGATPAADDVADETAEVEMAAEGEGEADDDNNDDDGDDDDDVAGTNEAIVMVGRAEASRRGGRGARTAE